MVLENAGITNDGKVDSLGNKSKNETRVTNQTPDVLFKPAGYQKKKEKVDEASSSLPIIIPYNDAIEAQLMQIATEKLKQNAQNKENNKQGWFGNTLKDLMVDDEDILKILEEMSNSGFQKLELAQIQKLETYLNNVRPCRIPALQEPEMLDYFEKITTALLKTTPALLKTTPALLKTTPALSKANNSRIPNSPIVPHK